MLDLLTACELPLASRSSTDGEAVQITYEASGGIGAGSPAKLSVSDDGRVTDSLKKPLLASDLEFLRQGQVRIFQ